MPGSKIYQLALGEQKPDEGYCDSSEICHLAPTNQPSTTAAPIFSQEEHTITRETTRTPDKITQEEMDKLKKMDALIESYSKRHSEEVKNLPGSKIYQLALEEQNDNGKTYTDTSNPSKQPAETYQITYKTITTPSSWGIDYGLKEAIAKASGSKNGDFMYLIITLGSKTFRLTPDLLAEYYAASDRTDFSEFFTKKFGWVKFIEEKELTAVLNLFIGNKYTRKWFDKLSWWSPKLQGAIRSTSWYGADTAFPAAAKIVSINYKNLVTGDTWTWADTGDVTSTAFYYGISNYLKLHNTNNKPSTASKILTAVAVEVPTLLVKLPFEGVSYLRESDQTKKEKALTKFKDDGYAFLSYTSAGIVPFGYTLRDSYYYSLSESDLEKAVIRQNIWVDLRDTVVSIAMGFIFWYQVNAVYNTFN